MPANFPDLWLGTVKTAIKTSAVALWLDGIAEISGSVSVVNGGETSERNLIYVPSHMFAVNVLLNNTTYPIPTQPYNDSTIILTLDKIQTLVTTLSDDDIVGANYDKIKEVTNCHVLAINAAKYMKAIHAIAPLQNSVTTPVLQTTGPVDSTNRKRLIYADLVEFKKRLDLTECSPLDRRLVLSTDHFNDLLLDRANFADKFINYKDGTSLDLLGFQIFTYISNPMYTTAGVKVPYGAVPPVGASRASVFFQKDNIGKKTGMTKQYFIDAKINPRGQSNELAYRHYFVALPYLNMYIGAIVNG